MIVVEASLIGAFSGEKERQEEAITALSMLISPSAKIRIEEIDNAEKIELRSGGTVL